MPNKINIDEDFFLLEAVKAGKEKIIRSIVSNGSPKNRNYRDAAGRTALHWASEYSYFKIVNILLELKWDMNAKDNKLHTPLHIACDHRAVDIASYLITSGCDVNVVDHQGNIPLQRAIHANLEEIVYLLCEKGADINSKNKKDWSPLHEAIRIGNERIVRLLIKLGADVNAVTEYNATPFSTAIFYHRIAQKNSYMSLESIAKMLIDNGSRLSQWDGQWTPIMSIISLGKSFIAGQLLYHGCLIPTAADCGRSLLVDAFTRCDSHVVKLLVHCGYRITIEEVEQCNRRIPTFSRSFRRLAFSGIDVGINGVKVLSWLRERAQNAMTLGELSRVSIRKALNAGADDKSILDNIQKLPLPQCMRGYIALQDLEHLLP